MTEVLFGSILVLAGIVFTFVAQLFKGKMHVGINVVSAVAIVVGFYYLYPSNNPLFRSLIIIFLAVGFGSLYADSVTDCFTPTVFADARLVSYKKKKAKIAIFSTIEFTIRAKGEVREVYIPAWCKDANIKEAMQELDKGNKKVLASQITYLDRTGLIENFSKVKQR